MDAFVDDYISSDEVKHGRPEPHMIFELMRRNGVGSPENVVKVGDTENDILEGLNAKCFKSVGVLSRAEDRERLLAAGASDVVNSVMDLSV